MFVQDWMQQHFLYVGNYSMQFRTIFFIFCNENVSHACLDDTVVVWVVASS